MLLVRMLSGGGKDVELDESALINFGVLRLGSDVES